MTDQQQKYDGDDDDEKKEPVEPDASNLPDDIGTRIGESEPGNEVVGEQ